MRKMHLEDDLLISSTLAFAIVPISVVCIWILKKLIWMKKDKYDKEMTSDDDFHIMVVNIPLPGCLYSQPSQLKMNLKAYFLQKLAPLL